jgi:hypothetical protein
MPLELACLALDPVLSIPLLCKCLLCEVDVREIAIGPLPEGEREFEGERERDGDKERECLREDLDTDLVGVDAGIVPDVVDFEIDMEIILTCRSST